MNAPRKGKMGRPKLPANQRRTTHCVFYTTPGEKKELQARAEKAGTSFSDFIADHFFPTKNEPAQE